MLGVVLAALTVGVWWKKTNVLELLVLGVVYWLCTWVISGMGLFVLDQFSLRRCVIAAVSVELLVGIAAVLVRKLRDKTPWKQLVRISWNVRTYWIPAVVLAGGFVLVAFKHELFGMGQTRCFPTWLDTTWKQRIIPLQSMTAMSVRFPASITESPPMHRCWQCGEKSSVWQICRGYRPYAMAVLFFCCFFFAKI